MSRRIEQEGAERDKRCVHPAVDGNEQVLRVAYRAYYAAGGDRKGQGEKQHLCRDPAPGGKPQNERRSDDGKCIIHEQCREHPEREDHTKDKLPGGAGMPEEAVEN